MGKKNKLQKFAELSALPNVYENADVKNPGLTVGGKPVDMKGFWNHKHFGNSNPITLELACGRGEYTLGMARMHPERNFIGVDIKGARIWRGAHAAMEENLENAAFLRTRIEQLALFFEPGEISAIWITFPDPFPEGGKINRRLTSPRFLAEFKNILKPGGLIHLKTDAHDLFDFTLKTLQSLPETDLCYSDDDIYAKPLPLPELEIKTYYENMHLSEGKTIKYLQWSL